MEKQYLKTWEQVAKYTADFMRTLGTGLILFSGLGFVFAREEVTQNIPESVILFFTGVFLVIAGAILILISTTE